ncbi:phosphoribosyltransferase [Streptomyces sp. ME01-24h]|nr:phosphoribosyltransferase [Streptomyces sp. ME19-03-3]MDX3357221.1 phosphoribosyltransferase [Streptomyces sp. ME01-24h]
MHFTDRADAGRQLAERLRHLDLDNPIVLGLPRGGVVVAYEVARALHAPLDVIVVRKLGVPYHPELGFGAIGEGGAKVLSDDIVHMSHVSRADIAGVEHREEAELARQAHRFREGRPRIPLAGRAVLLVDDGVATGATALAACEVARAQGAARVVLAVPVASPQALPALRRAADDVVCLSAPSAFFAVGEWYRDFAQTSDDEVSGLLEQAAARGGPRTTEVDLAVGGEAGARLAGTLTVPADARALVVFAHGSGSSRHSPRNRAVATVLNHSGLGTLLFDLLTSAEEADRANVFDIALLAGRLVDVTAWARGLNLPLAYFGASTGAAAALWAAADPRAAPYVSSVVSRGGRPDLAMSRLGEVRAPTLLIVGGRDTTVLELNQRAQEALDCPSLLHVVPGATHLFEEPGALDEVARLARDWVAGHLAAMAGP